MGVDIVEVADESDARILCSNDPAVKAGLTSSQWRHLNNILYNLLLCKHNAVSKLVSTTNHQPDGPCRKAPRVVDLTAIRELLSMRLTAASSEVNGYARNRPD